MSFKQVGRNNPNWKGGRLLASNGYVLLRVGRRHHLADVRGYAYEHRIVAEQILGRRLRAGELIHHKNGNKEDNRPGNLEVVASNAEHSFRHRHPDTALRTPGEPNPIISCACGCATPLLRYDDEGRPRIYIAGHNPQPSPTIDAVLAALAGGPLSRHQIVAITAKPTHAVATALAKLKRKRLVWQPVRGAWAITTSHLEQ